MKEQTRYEYKYILTQDKVKELKNFFDKKLVLDDFCKSNSNYKVINYNVDIINQQYTNKFLNKPKPKQQLRIKTYEEVNSEDSLVFFEVIKKFKGLISKKRTKIKFCEAMNMVNTKQMTNIKEYMDEQVIKDIHHILQSDDYILTSKIQFDRITYVSKDKKLRISFDFNIHNQVLWLPTNQVFMEIKSQNTIPLWLILELGKLKILANNSYKYNIDLVNKNQRQKYKN